MSTKRLVIVWNKEKDPKAKVIEVDDKQDETRAVINFLTRHWYWTPEELTTRADKEEVHVFDIGEMLSITETQANPEVVGTMALFLYDGESGNRTFADLVPIRRNETAKQALMERATSNLSEHITFKIPDILLTRTYGGEGTHLLTKVSSDRAIVVTIIGLVLFIDRSLAKALETFKLQSLWSEEPSGGLIWPTQVVTDFSAHIQALCEDHSTDAPCPLE